MLRPYIAHRFTSRQPIVNAHQTSMGVAAALSTNTLIQTLTELCTLKEYTAWKVETAMQVALPLTITDLALMPDDGSRYELLEGELVVSRAPSLSHQRISGNIFALVHTYLQTNPIGEIFATPGIVFDEFDSVIPDLVVVSYERRDQIVADDRFIAAPELVIEIVSPGEGNARRDRVTKRQIYSRFDVAEYWVVDPAQQSVEVYALDAGVLELRETLTGTDALRSSVLPAFTCPASDFFSR